MKALSARALYFLRAALRGLLTSPVTTVVAVATIGVSLVLVGAFALLLFNMEGLLERFGGQLHVTAYLEEGLSPERQRALAETARTAPGVADVRLVTEAEALERFREGVASGAAFLEGLDENPLPASLEIRLVEERRSVEGMQVVTGALSGLDGVDELASGQDWVEGYLRAIALVRALGLGLGAVLAFATLLIVANTIRLAVVARADELEILSLVGASRGFVSTPFLLEGFFQGVLGGLLALALLAVLYRLVLPGFSVGLELLVGSASPAFFGVGQASVLVATGALLGLFGSGAALLGGLRR